MSNSDEQIEQIEITIDEAKEIINKRKSLLNLTKNVDFKNIIDEGYFKNEASRVVALKADPQMQTEAFQKDLNNQIVAIGYLRVYFRTIIQLGEQAERDLIANEEAREEILKEGLSN